MQREDCLITYRGREPKKDFFSVNEGQVVASSVPHPPIGTPDSLYLIRVSGTEEFRPVYDALSRMRFYSLNLDALRSLQSPDPGSLLNRNGSNLASVLSGLEKSSPYFMESIKTYLGYLIPGPGWNQ